jgi:hypothetical protein
MTKEFRETIHLNNPQAADLTAEAIIRGERVVMPIGQVYGYLINVADLDLISSLWRELGRDWHPDMVDIEQIKREGIKKPVTAVTKSQFNNLVDWSVLGISPESGLAEVLTDSGVHTVLPVLHSVPEHLRVRYGEVDTLSMVVLSGQDQLFNQIVERLDKDHADVIVGGTSANLTGKPPYNKAEHLLADLGHTIDLLIIGDPEIDDLAGSDRLGMISILPDRVRVQRSGAGVNELMAGLHTFASEFVKAHGF